MRTSVFQLLLTSHYFTWVTTGTLTYPITPESLVSVSCTCSKGKEEAGLGFMMRKWTDSSRDPGVSDRAGGGRNVSRKLGTSALQAAQPGEGQWRSQEHAGVRGEGWSGGGGRSLGRGQKARSERLVA